MIAMDSNKKLTVEGTSIVTVKKEIDIIGFMKIPYDCVFDFSKIPKKDHEMALQMITNL